MVSNLSFEENTNSTGDAIAFFTKITATSTNPMENWKNRKC
jgi:hypothetical protein